MAVARRTHGPDQAAGQTGVRVARAPTITATAATNAHGHLKAPGPSVTRIP